MKLLDRRSAFAAIGAGAISLIAGEVAPDATMMQRPAAGSDLCQVSGWLRTDPDQRRSFRPVNARPGRPCAMPDERILLGRPRPDPDHRRPGGDRLSARRASRALAQTDNPLRVRRPRLCRRRSLGTISFEMLPQAQEFSSLPAAVAGFLLGFGAVYAFDLYIHHGVLAGEKAEQRFKVRQFYQTHPPRGDEITVLAGGTSSEELIEGLAIGVGAAIKPGLGLFIALAILIDNVSEALSIGLLIRDGARLAWRQVVRRTLEWTGLMGPLSSAPPLPAGSFSVACRCRCWASCSPRAAAACST